MISWVADHRKHHAFSDSPATPTARTSTTASAVRGTLHGLMHAHVGWLFVHDQRGARDRYAPDLLADPVMRFVDRWFCVWAVGGLAVAFGLGWAIGGASSRADGAAVGRGVRLFLLHHVTYSINSICHVFGRRRFETPTSRATCSGCRCSRSASLAQQPPRLPDVGPPRDGPLGARSVGPRDPRAGTDRVRVGCGPWPRAPAQAVRSRRGLRGNIPGRSSVPPWQFRFRAASSSPGSCSSCSSTSTASCSTSPGR